MTPLISCSFKISGKKSAVKMQNLFAFLNNVYLESENKEKQPWTMNNDASINQTMIFITQTYCDQKLRRKSAIIQKKPNTLVLCPATHDRWPRSPSQYFMASVPLTVEETSWFQYRCHETTKNSEIRIVKDW